jgi:alpha-ketoglutarate-dependent dioxygenase FTO
MDSAATDFKLEPTIEQDQIAVSWHADSSLEHYSNIAVYQLILEDCGSGVEKQTGTTTAAEDWSLALRVTPHAEGPTIKADHAPDTSVPTLSLKLSSGSAYYMLDDFNHHHQHAVLRDGNGKNNHKTNNQTAKTNKKDKKNKVNGKRAGSSDTPQSQAHSQQPHKTIRYSATYRLLRPSHTVQEVLDQCQKACRNFHKRGVKLWRSEQLLLTHVESEWLRQFYIQGQHHYDMLWQDWGTYIQQLWRYWSQLEQRTRQTLDLLQYAAEGKCHASAINTNANSKSTTLLSKAERKRRDKQKKAHVALQDLVARSHTDGNNCNVNTDIYEPIAELLQERATMRSQWQKREKDHVFATMERQYRPLALPIHYQSEERSTVATADETSNSNPAVAKSPLPEDLSLLVKQLRAFGNAYQSALMEDLPRDPIVAPPSERKQPPTSDKEQLAFSARDDASEDVAASQPSTAGNSPPMGYSAGGKSKRNKKKKRNAASGPDGGEKKKKKKKRRF